MKQAAKWVFKALTPVPNAKMREVLDWMDNPEAFEAKIKTQIANENTQKQRNNPYYLEF